jgi:hypothetical protein
MIVVTIKVYFNIAAPFLNLKIRWKIRNRKINMVGSKAGYILMLSQRFPFSNSINALCIPHPGHSMPRYFL